MNHRFTKRKRIAYLFLGIWAMPVCCPPLAQALTSGPVQPEVQGFTPAGVSDMVDLTTGDMKYNIPLLDIDGYPLNLNYQSGGSMEDEASWVGLGWNLNVGSITRQVRGVADDMNGDIVTTDHYTKPKITAGGRIRAKVEVGGSYIKAGGTFSLGVFSDNYTGIGAEVGVNPGITLSTGNDGPLTVGLGVGIMSSTAGGVDVSPYANLSLSAKAVSNITTSAGLSASLGYNTRSGMKDLSLGTSFGFSAAVTNSKKVMVDGKETEVKSTSSGSANYSLGGSTISYNTEPIMPKISVPYKSTYGSFSLDVGGSVYGIFIGGGATGYKSVREVVSKTNTNPAYGFLYADQGKNQRGAMMDFIREKDNPVIPDLPNLALPVSTPDLFSYGSQAGSGQFRLYRGGTGAYFDNEVSDVNSNTSIGVDLGWGSYFHGGVTLFNQNTSNTTRKWVDKNAFLGKGDFQDPSTSHPDYQHVGFRQVGEKTAEDLQSAIGQNGTGPVAVQIGNTTANNNFAGYGAINSTIQKQKRQAQNTAISYLTAVEASKRGLDKTLSAYAFNDYSATVPFTPPVSSTPTTIIRNSGYRKDHHLSEMTVTDGGGKRMVYGTPVYNSLEEDYTFAVGSKYDASNPYQLVSGSKDQIVFSSSTAKTSLGQNKGIDNYYHMDSHPAYASSFLLTAILSPDYVDKTLNGISDDDLGTALKFNYSMIPTYKWRTPYQNATLNRGMLADADDDKASIIYGEKEIWYASSIESKTKIAYFITENRDDALGVSGFAGGVNTTVRQKRLKEIRLYSKADMTKPIKVVKFDYDYSLCTGTPNSVAATTQGKLTLKSIHFEYGGVTKGKYFPYNFTYSTAYHTTAGTLISNVPYTTSSSDRWGMYRNAADNSVFSLTNDEFPYTLQDLYMNASNLKTSVNESAALFQLSHIDLPTGGSIDVKYESDDYAYVQDKQAMIMAPMGGLIDGGGNAVTGLIDAKGFKVAVPGEADNTNASLATDYFKRKYLNGSPYIYTKFSVKIANSNSAISPDLEQQYDFVPCYSKVQSVTIAGGYAKVILEDRTEGSLTKNPIIFSAWQRIKDEYPRYAYPGFDRRVGSEGIGQSVGSAVLAVVDALGNLSELSQNFYEKANSSSKRYADIIRPTKCFVRIAKPDGHKLGGGSRVSKVMINNAWDSMSGVASTQQSFGQAYDYTMQEDNLTKSSGVASYEPAVGNDENPLKQPVFYIEKIKGAIDNVFDLEEPFGESFFPAPSVIYSKVTVSDLDPSGNPYPISSPGPTGYTVNDFYTARDFPVKVGITPMQKYQYRPKTKYSMIETNSIDELTLSQGYSVELNDMHGKPKDTYVYNQAGAEISSEINYYNGSPKGAVPMRLKNQVTVVNPDGSVVPNTVMGRDVEFFTDFREQETVNNGETYNIGVDIIPAFFIPLPIPHFPTAGNSEYKLFRSACAVKVSQYYGIIDSVVRKVNGSTIKSENLAYDGQTGQPVITRTQNEFNQNIYSISIPAYWGYSGMGPASQNVGMMLPAFTTTSTAELPVNMKTYLHTGDEFTSMSDGISYWVVAETIDTRNGPAVYLPGNGGFPENTAVTGIQHINVVMDQYGRLKTSYAMPASKIVRSGYRNMLGADLTKLVTLVNPIVPSGGGYRLALDNSDLTAYKVLNASASTYDDNWSTMVPDIHPIKGTDPYDLTVHTGYVNLAVQPYVYIDGQVQSGVINGYFAGREAQSFIGDDYYGNPRLYEPNSSKVMGVLGTYYIPKTKTYYVGYDSQPSLSFSLDVNCGRNSWFQTNVHTPYNQRSWYMVPTTLTQGWHTLRMEMTYGSYNPNAPGPYPAPNGAGVEIYDNTSAELQYAGANSGSGLKVLFSSKDLIGTGTFVYHINNAGTTTFYQNYYNDQLHTPYSPCTVPPLQVNPYMYGFAGNWRPFQTEVFQQKRIYANILNPTSSVVNVKSTGYIGNFQSYWFLPVGTQTLWQINNANKSWVTANTVTLYDKYGQELENKDALSRFSAAKFDFYGEFPGAVASNAKNREIYANSFEDAQFQQGKVVYIDNPKINEFVLSSTGAYLPTAVQNGIAHTGNFCAAITADSLVLNTTMFKVEQKTQPYMDIDATRQFIKATRPGLYPNGFEPMPNKDYLVNIWVKDNMPTTKVANMNLYINNVLQAPMVCKAIVEDWKLLEGRFKTANSPDGTAIKITLLPTSSSTMYLDDFRIHPFDSHMKTYSYDASTLRLMAELDENAFATFYEYDSEGLLIRVKKETERGIMTIKESRSSHKKGTPYTP